MIQFYSPDILTTLSLPPEESQHCVRVLRHKEGDEICVIDGLGNRYACRITEAYPRSVMVEIISETKIPDFWKVNITLAVAPTKNMDRLEWLTEKAVEYGINKIIPVICEHSERKVVKVDRLRKIAVSAMKQSLKASLPEIEESISFSTFLKNIQTDNGNSSGENPQKFMGYCDKAYPLKNLIAEYTPGRNVVILIGPEGDFSESEVSAAVEAGFIPVTFGESRFRTETAALASIAIIHFLNQQSSN